MTPPARISARADTTPPEPGPDLEAIRQQLGQRIRACRERLGYSQICLAERTGLNRSYIGALERGEHNPGINNLARIAHGLGIRLQDLFTKRPPAPATTQATPQLVRDRSAHVQVNRAQFMQLLEQCAPDRPDLVIIYLARLGVDFHG